MNRKRSRKLEKRIEAATARIGRLGGKMAISPDTPDWIVSAFLNEIDDCPLCRALERKTGH